MTRKPLRIKVFGDCAEAGEEEDQERKSVRGERFADRLGNFLRKLQAIRTNLAMRN